MRQRQIYKSKSRQRNGGGGWLPPHDSNLPVQTPAKEGPLTELIRWINSMDHRFLNTNTLVRLMEQVPNLTAEAQEFLRLHRHLPGIEVATVRSRLLPVLKAVR